MKAISIINRKGGVGKTTTTVNLANEIARLDMNVLLIDLDSQIDLTKFFIKNNYLGMLDTIQDVLENTCKASDAIVEVEGKENLNLLGNLYNKELLESTISVDSSIIYSHKLKKPVRDMKYRPRSVSQFQRAAEELLLRVVEDEAENVDKDSESINTTNAEVDKYDY